MQTHLQACRSSFQRARDKMDKLSNQLKGKLNSEYWFENIDYSSSHLQRKCSKLVKLSGHALSQYFGEFSRDLRQGSGMVYLPPSMGCNLFRGQFSDDKPHGRGIYIFNICFKSAGAASKVISSQNVSKGASLYYVGEFNDGVADGMGKVVSDGMRYYGTIRMGQMHCTSAKIEYDNGDEYRGEVQQGLKVDSGNAKYTYLNGDTYEGPFSNDQKHTEPG